MKKEILPIIFLIMFLITSCAKLGHTSIIQNHFVSFLAFHDLNGNEIRESDEPLLEGIKIQVQGKECLTGNNGECQIHQLKDGRDLVRIVDNREVADEEKMDYIFPSVSELRTNEQGIEIEINQDIAIPIPLGQGFLSWPFSPDIRFSISNYFDLDLTNCPEGSEPHTCPNIRDWQGGSNTYDNHTGTDILAPLGTPILAVAPGEVIVSGYDSAAGNHIVIRVNSTIVVNYNHLETIEVNEGDHIVRGQEIGTVGSTGNSSTPHLHLELQVNNTPEDLYKDQNSPSSTNYWILLNNH